MSPALFSRTVESTIHESPWWDYMVVASLVLHWFLQDEDAPSTM